MSKQNDLKLIYVLKIGRNSKGEGIYEFIFSKDIENVNIEDWNWDQSPAMEYKDITVPEPEYIDAVYSLTTKDFALFCLCDATDRPYIHGYHLIHALAYEDEDDESLNDELDFEDMIEDEDILNKPLLVFHYGMTIKSVEDKLYERNIILKGNTFINTSSIKV